MRLYLILCMAISHVFAVATSGTDSSIYYKDLCLKASIDQDFFLQFRRFPLYIGNLGEPGKAVAMNIYSYIKKSNPELLDNFMVFHELESIGDPYLCQFSKNITCSTATIRYLGVLSELIKYYSSLNDMEIVEIGGGFGGQCYVISKWFNPKSYTIIDLPEAIALQKRVLSTLGVHNVKFIEHTNVFHKIKSDLLISNYAFSECMPSMQRIYLSKVISGAGAGYMIMNNGTTVDSVRTMNKNHIFKVISSFACNPFIKEEFVSSYPSNYTIVW